MKSNNSKIVADDNIEVNDESKNTMVDHSFDFKEKKSNEYYTSYQVNIYDKYEDEYETDDREEERCELSIHAQMCSCLNDLGRLHIF